MSEVTRRLATKEAVDAVKEAIEALPNATQAAADAANEAAANATQAAAAIAGMVADTYSSSSTYFIGNYVYYNGNLYRCIVDITTAEAWTAAHWEQVSIANDVFNFKSDMKSDINKAISYNLIGMDADTKYPVELKGGDKVVFSKKDGSKWATNGSDSVDFITAAGTERLTQPLVSGAVTHVVTLDASIAEISYLKWNSMPSVPVMANFGDTKKEYEPYNDSLDKNVSANTKSITNHEKSLINNGMIPKIGNRKNYEVLFTSEDVKPGDIIHVDFVSPQGDTIGYICFVNSSGQSVPFYVDSYRGFVERNFVGRDAAVRTDTYNEEFIAPEGFANCIVRCDDNSSIVISRFDVLYQKDIKNSEALIVPEYYQTGDYINAKIYAINERLEEVLSHGDSFAFITDLHLSDNAQKSPALLKYLAKNTSVNKLFIGGDIVDGGNWQEYPVIRTYMNLIHEGFNGNVHFVVGNHDTFRDNPSSRISAWSDAYHNEFNGNAENHYYYVDNQRAKIRYIVLSAFYEGSNNESNGIAVDTEQQTWFHDEALNLAEGWGAVVFIHAIYNYTYETTRTLVYSSDLWEAVCDVCDDYNADTESAGEVIAIVQGHTHCDRVLRTTGGIPIIITTCDKYRHLDPTDIPFPDGVADRSPGTIREQAIDVMIINRRRDANDKGTIYAMRIGCEAYDGTTIESMGSPTQERIIKYDSKFDY